MSEMPGNGVEGDSFERFINGLGDVVVNTEELLGKLEAIFSQSEMSVNDFLNDPMYTGHISGKYLGLDYIRHFKSVLFPRLNEIFDLNNEAVVSDLLVILFPNEKLYISYPEIGNFDYISHYTYDITERDKLYEYKVCILLIEFANNLITFSSIYNDREYSYMAQYACGGFEGRETNILLGGILFFSSLKNESLFSDKINKLVENLKTYIISELSSRLSRFENNDENKQDEYFNGILEGVIQYANLIKQELKPRECGALEKLIKRFPPTEK